MPFSHICPVPAYNSSATTAASRFSGHMRRAQPQRASAPNSVSSGPVRAGRSEEHTSELQSLMRISYAVFCLQKNKKKKNHTDNIQSKNTCVTIDTTRPRIDNN